MILRYISPFILEKERIVDWHSKYLLPLAHFLLKTEKLSELEWLVTQFSQEQNNSAAGWNLKGGLHWGQGNLEEALFCYKSGTEVDSLSIKNWMNLGVLYRLTGNLENSLKAFEQCYILHPEIPQVINNLAEALLSVEGDSERMLKLIQQAIEKANNTQVLLYRRTEFQIRLHRKEFSEAEILIYKLLQEDKTIVHFLKDLYNDLSNNGKQHQAAFCKKILTESMI
jgi:tetratricopeptide (TPR) repeat protein